MKDNNLVYVAEERRRLMREFGDMIFDGADQADIDAKYKEYAKVLLPLFLDERTVFVISSDFCHWGSRFRFTHQYEDEPVIHKSIERLDKNGMQLIENQSFNDFTRYLDDT